MDVRIDHGEWRDKKKKKIMESDYGYVQNAST